LRDRDEIRIGGTTLAFDDAADARVHELSTVPDQRVELPSPPPEPEPPEGAEEDTVADDGPPVGPGETPAQRDPPPPRATASGDIVIYLLAAAVLALSIAGLVLLLSSG
jgi:hypothetical protein